MLKYFKVRDSKVFEVKEVVRKFQNVGFEISEIVIIDTDPNSIFPHISINPDLITEEMLQEDFLNETYISAASAAIEDKSSHLRFIQIMYLYMSIGEDKLVYENVIQYNTKTKQLTFSTANLER